MSIKPCSCGPLPLPTRIFCGLDRCRTVSVFLFCFCGAPSQCEVISSYRTSLVRVLTATLVHGGCEPKIFPVGCCVGLPLVFSLPTPSFSSSNPTSRWISPLAFGPMKIQRIRLFPLLFFLFLPPPLFFPRLDLHVEFQWLEDYSEPLTPVTSIALLPRRAQIGLGFHYAVHSKHRHIARVFLIPEGEWRGHKTGSS